MKRIVIYQSKTGFTEKYAKWIAEELKCEAKAWEEKEAYKYEAYDVVIFGGGLMAGRIAKLGKVKGSPGLQGKKLILFATGATRKDAAEVIEQVKNDNLTREEQQKIPFFYFEGGINYEKMGFASRTILKKIHKSLLKKADKTEAETGMMHAIEKSRDSSDKRAIEPLLEYVRGL